MNIKAIGSLLARSSLLMHGKFSSSSRSPSRSLIVALHRAMLHDEQIYPDPFEFKPERFMKDGKFNKELRDPEHACFGFGRR